MASEKKPSLWARSAQSARQLTRALHFTFNFISIAPHANLRNCSFVQGASAASAPTPALHQTLPSNSFLVSRDALLQRIEDSLSEQLKGSRPDPLVVLCGPGGMGKTTISYAFAQQQQRDAQGNAMFAVRIRVESRDTMEKDYSDLAELLQLQVEGKSFRQIAQAVREALVSRYKSGVIVFDNAEAYDSLFDDVKGENVGETLKSLWPKGHQFTKIVTTRNKTLWPPRSVVQVSSMHSREAMALLEKITDRSAQDLERMRAFLKDVLGNCPLAVCQIASQLADKSIDVGAFLESCAAVQQSQSILSENVRIPDLTCDGETPAYRRAILTTFNISLAALRAKDLRFSRVLEDAAFMDAECIIPQHLYALATERDQSFDASKRKDFRAAVHSTSLMEVEATIANMHRIVQLVLRFSVDQQGGAAAALLRALLRYFGAQLHSDRNAVMNFAFLLRHIDAATSVFSQLSTSDAAVLQGHIALGKQYLIQKHPSAALSAVRKALRHGDAQEAAARDVAEKLALDAIAMAEWNQVDASWMVDFLKMLRSDALNKAFGLLSSSAAAHLKVLDQNWQAPQLVSLENDHSTASNLLVLASVLHASPSYREFAEKVMNRVAGVAQSGLKFVTNAIEEMESTLADIEESAAERHEPTARQESAMESLRASISERQEQKDVLEPLCENALKVCEQFQVEHAPNSKRRRA